MAPKYKLTYFNIRGLGEPIRYLFLYGDIDFEDERIEMDEWAELKNKYPVGKLPILQVDGKAFTQSSAICRLLARKVGLAGADDAEAAAVDATVDTITDLRVPCTQLYWEVPEDQKQQRKEFLLKEHVPTYLQYLEKQVEENNGYFVNGKLSWADLYFAALFDTINYYLGEDLLASYPNLQGLVNKVHSLPTIKSWVEKRPKTGL